VQCHLLTQNQGFGDTQVIVPIAIFVAKEKTIIK